MKPITQEWVDKAEGDWAALGRELRARKAPNYDDACFHAQQCAEKYLKARLQEASVAFPRTHNLLDLLSLALPVEPLWGALYRALDTLNDYAIIFRYPGRSADKAEAQEAKSRFQNLCHARKQISAQPRLSKAWCIWALRS